MRVLYAIQGTGNGHLSRARDIVPLLKEQQVDVELLVSGTQSQVVFPYRIDHQFQGISFLYNKRGGVDYGRTVVSNFSRCFWREMHALEVERFDLVINDFEPVSAWAARLHQVPCVALGHQASFFSPLAPRPSRKEWLGEQVLQRYAPADNWVGFHFDAYDTGIHTPVIRQEVRNLQATNRGHYTVYLPAMSDKRLIRLLSHIPEVDWQVFSRTSRISYRHQNIWIHPIENQTFLESLAGAEGILTGAGFELPAESLYLGKKLCVVPIKRQYEQQCNAAALARLGVPVIYRLNTRSLIALRDWVWHQGAIPVSYPDETRDILTQLLQSNVYRRETATALTAC